MNQLLPSKLLQYSSKSNINSNDIMAPPNLTLQQCATMCVQCSTTTWKLPFQILMQFNEWANDVVAGMHRCRERRDYLSTSIVDENKWAIFLEEKASRADSEREWLYYCHGGCRQRRLLRCENYIVVQIITTTGEIHCVFHNNVVLV